MKGAMEKFVSELIKFCASVISVILRGYTLSIMWGWFVVSTFAIAPLSVPAAIGINMLMALFTKSVNRADTEREDAVWFNIWFNLMWSVAALAVGWVVMKFM